MKKILILPVIFLLMVSLVHASTLSITESKYNEIDPNLMSSAWSLVIRGDNAAEWIAFANPEDIQGEKNDIPIQAEEGFKLDTEITSESCNYDLYDSASVEDIFSYRLVKERNNIWPWQVDEALDNCKAKDSLLAWHKHIIGFDHDIYCLYRDSEATAGEVGEGIMNFESKFSLSKGNEEPIIKTISSTIRSEEGLPPGVTFKDDNKNVAIINWIGGSTYGEFCPGQDDVLAIQNAETGEWSTGSKYDYNQYLVKHNDIEDIINIYKEQDTLPSNIRAELDTLVFSNNARADLVLEKEHIKLGTNTAKINGANAALDLPRSHYLYLPDFKMLISTSWIKTVYMVGKPQITDSGINNCAEGSPENEIYVTMSNIGASSGHFLVGIKCESGIQVTNPQQSITLKPEESGTLTYTFSLDLPEDAQKSCSITVQDSLDHGNMDTATVSADCTSTSFCENEGATWCVGNVEYTCIGGMTLNTESENCIVPDKCNGDGDCDILSGESFEVCGGKTNPKNDCATCNGDGHCDSTETEWSCAQDCTLAPKPFPWAQIIMGVAGAVLLFLITDKIKSKKQPTKRRKKR